MFCGEFRGGKNSKKDIAGFHYYLAKGDFAGRGAEAYVCISVAEFKDGERVYDLDLANVEDVVQYKGEAATLPATRVSSTGPTEAASPHVGRVHQMKAFVNYIDKREAENSENPNLSMTEAKERGLVSVSSRLLRRVG